MGVGEGTGAQNPGQSGKFSQGLALSVSPRRPFIPSISCIPLIFRSCCVISNKIKTPDINILTTVQPGKLLLYVHCFMPLLLF